MLADFDLLTLHLAAVELPLHTCVASCISGHSTCATNAGEDRKEDLGLICEFLAKDEAGITNVHSRLRASRRFSSTVRRQESEPAPGAGSAVLGDAIGAKHG